MSFCPPSPQPSPIGGRGNDTEDSGLFAGSFKVLQCYQHSNIPSLLLSLNVRIRHGRDRHSEWKVPQACSVPGDQDFL
jgi:hypothetical protein